MTNYISLSCHKIQFSLAGSVQSSQFQSSSCHKIKELLNQTHQETETCNSYSMIQSNNHNTTPDEKKLKEAPKINTWVYY
ncbi:uncharacterized protein DS421_11g336920 [Arachis hypogaea]|nr:uncharacterized protein DS421_11g336920 [Arachis hypogaea]